LEVGQKIELDVFGLKVAGLRPGTDRASGTVVAVGPGTITVRVEGGPDGNELTISPNRLRA
jgi:hypothetical protein